MRRSSKSLFSVLLTAGVLATFSDPGSASAKTLKIATIAPGGSAWMVQMKAAADKIAADTEGRVTLKFYPGGVMGNDQTVLRKIRAGQLQGGAFGSGPLASIFPDIDLYSLPLMFRSYEEVDYVRKRLDKELIDGLEKKGFSVVSFSDNGFAYLMSTKPVRTVADLKTKKVWIPQGDVMSETALNVCGVSPIQLPLPDVYTGLQSGLIDTVAVPPIGAIAFQWHTSVKYMTDTPLMYLLGMLIVDARAWRQISEADRKIVREHAQKAAANMDKENRVSERNAVEALESQGIEIVSPASSEELERWHAITQDALKQLRSLGIYSNDRIDRIEKYLAEYRSQNGGADGS
jgi:TRAP-type C4-dicarboxylate transport system substrate-binding protein